MPVFERNVFNHCRCTFFLEKNESNRMIFKRLSFFFFTCLLINAQFLKIYSIKTANAMIQNAVIKTLNVHLPVLLVIVCIIHGFCRPTVENTVRAQNEQ